MSEAKNDTCHMVINLELYSKGRLEFHSIKCGEPFENEPKKIEQ